MPREQSETPTEKQSCYRCGSPGPTLYVVKKADDIVCNDCRTPSIGDGKIRLHEHDWEASGVVEQEYMQPAVLEECQSVGCKAWRDRTLAGVNRVEEWDDD